MTSSLKNELFHVKQNMFVFGEKSKYFFGWIAQRLCHPWVRKDLFFAEKQ